MKKRTAKVVINNKLKGSFGAMNPKTNKVEINFRAHKGDKQELASTVKHELLHVKHPKMTEKEVYKNSAKTKIAEPEKHKLLAKLNTKARNYKIGAEKRKFKLGKRDLQPGELFNNYQKQKTTKVSIAGLV